MALVQDERSRAFDAIAVLITRLGDFHVQLATGTLLTVLLLAAGRWQAGLFVTGSLLLAATATTILKHLLEAHTPGCPATPPGELQPAERPYLGGVRRSFWPWVYWQDAAARHGHVYVGWW